jgi:16S rRNA (cytidine1402-2'-O)-methyltransferase
MNGKIYLVATPIGNLGDITLRAIDVLKEEDFIIAEDTRVTSRLLAHLEIKKPMYAFHERSAKEKIKPMLERAQEGESIAVVCDAGTPGISDPGGYLVQEAVNLGLEVIPIPGASALTAAFSVYGQRIPGFEFLGFFPKKGKTKVLERLRQTELPVAFYESPYRIKKVLNIILEGVGDREVLVGRELTKKFETIYRGRISEVLPQVKEKGEFVLIVSGKNDKARYSEED